MNYVRCLESLMVLLAVASVAAAQPPRPKMPDGTKAHANLEYVAGGHARQRLDLFVPTNADTPLPVIVWVHGGAWMGGSKDGGGPALPFAGKGYAVASINYRLSQHAVFPAQIEDCKGAIRWLRANAKTYNLNPERIGVWGASAGGHLVALLGTSGGVEDREGKGGNLDQSSRVQAVVDFFGPTDFLQMDAHALPGARLKHDVPTSPESRLIGGAIQENVEKVGRANPIKYVTKDAPPFLIVHGEQDPLVPCHQSELLYQALKQVRSDVTFYKIAGSGHGSPEFHTDMMRAAVQAFFDKHLKPRSDRNAKTPPQPEGGKDKQPKNGPAVTSRRPG
jgi:acetyl esterase/lipase